MLTITRDNVNVELPYLHDGIFLGFQYDEETHTLRFRTKIHHVCTAYCIEFRSVYGIDMQCCDDWGYSPNIYDWTVEEGRNAPLTQRLLAQADEKYKREGLKQAVEGLVLFISGNALRVSCAQIGITPEAFTPEDGLL